MNASEDQPPLPNEVYIPGFTYALSDTNAVYLYIDEAGNFDFSKTGSKFLILTCVALRRPFTHIMDLSVIKYSCLERGLDPKRCRNYHEFHANEDSWKVKGAVYDIISGQIDGARVYSVVLRKNMTNPVLRSPEKLYAKAFEWLTGYVASHEGITADNMAIAVTDYINFKGKNDALRVALMQYMERRFDSRGIESRLYQHQSQSDLNLQVADYCCWAIQRKWEKGDTTAYDKIKHLVKGEGDLFKNGDKVYYEFAK